MPLQSLVAEHLPLPSKAPAPPPPEHPPSPQARRWGAARWVTLAVAAAHMIRHACQLDRRPGQRRGGGSGGGSGGGRGSGRCTLSEEAEGARLGVSQPRGAHLRPWGSDGVAMGWRWGGGGGAARDAARTRVRVRVRVRGQGQWRWQGHASCSRAEIPRRA